MMQRQRVARIAVGAHRGVHGAGRRTSRVRGPGRSSTTSHSGAVGSRTTVTPTTSTSCAMSARFSLP